MAKLKQDTDLFKIVKTIKKLRVASKILLPDYIRKSIGFSKHFIVEEEIKKEKWRQYLQNVGHLKQLLKAGE